MSTSLFEDKPAVLEPPCIRFTVYGKPQPQGSSRAFTPPGWTRPIITSDNAKLKPWRQQMAVTAMDLGLTPFIKEIPVAVSLDFYFEKPASVPKRRVRPTVKPDLDKLIRAVLDSCKGAIYTDDSQVVRFDHIEKHYGLPERVEIQVRVL